MIENYHNRQKKLEEYNYIIWYDPNFQVHGVRLLVLDKNL